MGRKLDGEDRAIGNADVGCAIDDQVRIDDAAVLQGQHSTRATRMILRADHGAKPVVPVIVGLDGGAWEDFLDRGVGQRLRLTDGAGELDALAKHDDVCQATRHVRDT